MFKYYEVFKIRFPIPNTGKKLEGERSNCQIKNKYESIAIHKTETVYDDENKKINITNHSHLYWYEAHRIHISYHEFILMMYL